MLPEKGKFTQQFTNEQLQAQAAKVWQQLDEWSLVLLVAGILIGVMTAVYYYTTFNNKPGRHYKLIYWLIGLFLASLLGLIFTAIFEYFLIKTNLKSGIYLLYGKCALNNAFYCALSYLVTSIVWCNYLPTNANRLFKIKSSS
jgi:uncharacterized membrane protein YraQ (UPF0718 family)